MSLFRLEDRFRDLRSSPRFEVHYLGLIDLGREATAADPEGVAALRDWAWRDLERIGYVDYRVEKPTHDLRAVDLERTTGNVTFTAALTGASRASSTRTSLMSTRRR